MTELETDPRETRITWWGSREGIAIVRQPAPRPGPRRPAPPAERPVAR